MKIKQVDNPSKEAISFDGEYPKKLQPTDIVEIFQTPLTGSYNWIIQYKIIVFVNCMNLVKN